MTDKKWDINWYFVLCGFVILYYGLSNNLDTREQFAVRKISIELSRDVVNVKGRNPIDYKFWCKQYDNQFKILNGSISTGKHRLIGNLKEGQVIDIFLSNMDFKKMGHSNSSVIVRGVTLNEEPLLSPSECKRNRFLYKTRLIIATVFGGLMFLLNGLVSIPREINCALVGALFGAILIMRIFEFGLY
ncbi:MAG: hypothetical protein AAFV95_02835 [Bacteroidota bacterium]